MEIVNARQNARTRVRFDGRSRRQGKKVMTGNAQSIASGGRFEFGRNWTDFLTVVTDDRICAARRSLQSMLGLEDLVGKTFLDIGSGSGLFSLAAARLGARVHSFDYDTGSVACTRELKQRFAPTSDWTVEQGSVLDGDYLTRLGQFDVVYSWGVLHHTGAMWRALENVAPLVRPGGKLFISIYNDQGSASRRWRAIKRAYNRAPRLLRPLVLFPVMFVWEGRMLLGCLIHRRSPFRDWRATREERGMSWWHDWVDWIGGYPFEVAKPEEVFSFCRDRGFTLSELRTEGGNLGCNQFVFRKSG